MGWHAQTYAAQAVAARSYTLATLKPGADFDLYPDDRSQMYGGIRAERTETNLAVGATAGQVLEWGNTIIPAYYFSTSGGRTSSIHDAWPHLHQVPYLVSVADPYDYISPHHVWPTTVLTDQQVAHGPGVERRARPARRPQLVGSCAGRARADTERLEAVRRSRGAGEVQARFDGLRDSCADARRRHATGHLRRPRRRPRMASRARQGAAPGADGPGLGDRSARPPGALGTVRRLASRGAVDRVPPRLQRCRRRHGLACR